MEIVKKKRGRVKGSKNADKLNWKTFPKGQHVFTVEFEVGEKKTTFSGKINKGAFIEGELLGKKIITYHISANGKVVYKGGAYEYRKNAESDCIGRLFRELVDQHLYDNASKKNAK